MQATNAAASLLQEEGSDVSVLLPASGAPDPGASAADTSCRGSLRQALTGLQFKAFVSHDARGALLSHSLHRQAMAEPAVAAQPCFSRTHLKYTANTLQLSRYEFKCLLSY